MLRDYHVDNQEVEFSLPHEKSKRALLLKTSQQIYFCNSNWCQVKTNNKFSSGDSDIQPESFSFRSAAEYLNFYFRHLLSTY